MKPIYLDCNATTPIEKEVTETVIFYLEKEYGNSGSRTHVYGNNANQAVEASRKHIAELVSSEKDEIIFTSGATESNNLAILGLKNYGFDTKRNHIVSTTIEHKAVLEPLEHLEKNGFEVTLVDVGKSGRLDPSQVESAVRDNTLLVSVMHANNETGILQPIDELANMLYDSDILLHVDAAQGYGKEIEPLQNQGVDLISVSGHKIYGPKGIGALVRRRRKESRIDPLFLGGGQERGLRPGTLPVHLIAGLGKASELAKQNHLERKKINENFKIDLLQAFETLNPTIFGDQNYCLANVVSLSFGAFDSEAIMLLLKDEVSISNGSACTSSNYEPSHVLTAIGASEDEAEGVTRWSWCHLTVQPDWDKIVETIEKLK